MIYGGGDAKLGLIVKDDALAAGKPAPSGALSKLGKKARSLIESGITGFGTLAAGVKKRHQQKGWLKSLDGRFIESDSAHSALNTLLQGGGAVVMKWALVLFHFELAVSKGWVDPTTFLPTKNPASGRPWLSYCANVHDEVQMSVEPEVAEEVGRTFADAIRLAGERLGMRCPLAGAFDVGDTWADTH